MSAMSRGTTVLPSPDKFLAFRTNAIWLERNGFWLMSVTKAFRDSEAPPLVDLLGQEMGQEAPQTPADLHVARSRGNRLLSCPTYPSGFIGLGS